jgi:hypothetical protein
MFHNPQTLTKCHVMVDSQSRQAVHFSLLGQYGLTAESRAICWDLTRSQVYSKSSDTTTTQVYTETRTKQTIEPYRIFTHTHKSIADWCWGRATCLYRPLLRRTFAHPQEGCARKILECSNSSQLACEVKAFQILPERENSVTAKISPPLQELASRMYVSSCNHQRVLEYGSITAIRFFWGHSPCRFLLILWDFPFSWAWSHDSTKKHFSR